jgi:hypothetical protein
MSLGTAHWHRKTGVSAGPDAVSETVTAFADIGASDLILNPALGDLDQISRLADVVF